MKQLFLRCQNIIRLIPRIQALGFQFTESMTADCDKTSIKMLQLGHSEHHYRTIGEFLDNKDCMWHGKRCTPTSPLLFVAGFPCTPFSLQRANHATTRFPDRVARQQTETHNPLVTESRGFSGHLEHILVKIKVTALSLVACWLLSLARSLQPLTVFQVCFLTILKLSGSPSWLKVSLGLRSLQVVYTS